MNSAIDPAFAVLHFVRPPCEAQLASSSPIQVVCPSCCFPWDHLSPLVPSLIEPDKCLMMSIPPALLVWIMPL